MPKQIEFEGQVHEFPDNFTDVDISTALSSHSESAPKKQSWPAWGMEQAGGLVQGTAESMNPLPAAKLAYRLGPVNLANFDPKGNNPDSTINTVRQLIGDPIVRGVANSVKSGMAGRPMDAMNDLIYGVPLIGPAIESGMEDVKAGRYGHAIGSVVGAIFGPKVLSKGIAAIPKVGLARGIQRASVDFPKIKNPEPAFLAERDAALDFQRQQGWSSNAATAEKGGKIQQAIAGWKPQVAASIAKAEAGGAPGVLLSDVVQPMIDLRNKTSASMFPENANAIDQRIGVVIDLAKGPQKIRLPGSKKVLLHGTPAYYKEVARQYIAKSTEIPPSDAQMAADRAAQTAELSQPYSLNGPRPPLSGRPFPVMEDGPPGTPVPDTTRIPLKF